MTRPKQTTKTATIEPGILSKSGLDITLENIDKHLASIDDKLAAAPTMADYQALRDDLDKAQSGLDTIKEQHTEALNKLKADHDNDVQALEQKYASKLTERIVYGAAGLILVAAFGAIVALVIN